MSASYLTLLLATLICLVIVDRRWKLAFYSDPKRSLKTVGLCWVLFLAWDLLGVSLGIFYPGNSQYDLGILLLPGLPLEEPLFLLVLVYLSLLLWRGRERYVGLHNS